MQFNNEGAFFSDTPAFAYARVMGSPGGHSVVANTQMAGSEQRGLPEIVFRFNQPMIEAAGSSIGLPPHDPRMAPDYFKPGTEAYLKRSFVTPPANVGGGA